MGCSCLEKQQKLPMLRFKIESNISSKKSKEFSPGTLMVNV